MSVSLSSWRRGVVVVIAVVVGPTNKVKLQVNRENAIRLTVSLSHTLFACSDAPPESGKRKRPYTEIASEWSRARFWVDVVVVVVSSSTTSVATPSAASLVQMAQLKRFPNNFYLVTGFRSECDGAPCVVSFPRKVNVVPLIAGGLLDR